VKQERFDRMLAMQQEISREIWAADVGTELEVLVEGASKVGKGQIFGRTTWNRIVNFTGPEDLAGRVVPVRITKSYRNSQLGELRQVSGDNLYE
jgi:tRNA-2-methylthio-N6-dimethylallyladenosine synthase